MEPSEPAWGKERPVNIDEIIRTYYELRARRPERLGILVNDRGLETLRRMVDYATDQLLQREDEFFGMPLKVSRDLPEGVDFKLVPLDGAEWGGSAASSGCARIGYETGSLMDSKHEFVDGINGDRCWHVVRVVEHYCDQPRSAPCHTPQPSPAPEAKSPPGRQWSPQPICGGCGFPIWGEVEQRELTYRHAGGPLVCAEVEHAAKHQRMRDADKYDAEKRQFASWLGVKT